MKINHILFPVDYSDSSRAMNLEVEQIANHFKAEVTLLNVFEIPVAWYGACEAPLMDAECFQNFAAEARQRLTAYSIDVPARRVHRLLHEGDAAWHIQQLVQDGGIDMVMMATHGYGSLQRLFLGSVAMKVLHHVGCPVWTHPAGVEVRSTNSFKPSSILCALELTEEAVPLLRFVKDLAVEFSAKVHLVHSIPETTVASYRYFERDLHQYLKESAANAITGFQHQAETNFPLIVADGLIPDDLARLAKTQAADLVVIGRGKARNVLGTLRTHAYEIIRHAPCPVLSYASALAEIQTDPESKRQHEMTLSVS